MALLVIMATKKYNPLIDYVLANAKVDGAPIAISIYDTTLSLETIKKGMIKAKSEYTIRGQIPGNVKLQFYTVPKNFNGFKVALRTWNRLTKNDI